MSVEDFFERLASEVPAIADVSPEVDPPFILAGNVYRARTRRGLTQAQLAERVGVRQPRIAEIERGDANPRLDTIARVAHALGISVSALLDESARQDVDRDHSSSSPGRLAAEAPSAADAAGHTRPPAIARSERHERSGAARREKNVSRRSAA